MVRTDGPENAYPRTIEPDTLATLLRVSSALASSVELPVVLQTAIEGAVEVLGLDMGVVYLLEDGELYLGAASPPLPPHFPDEHRRASLCDHPHLERCLTSLEPVIVSDVLQEELSPQERIVVESGDLRSAVFAPMAVDGKALGALIVHTVGRVREFDEHDVGLCHTVSHQISLAVENALLFRVADQNMRELAAAYDATLKGWSLALDMRDEDTGFHTARVTNMTLRLAARMGMDKDELVHVRRGALLHDIGKMVVPDAILHKPGPLDEHEWALMKKHPQSAHRMLEGIDYLAPAIDIPWCHHERWDGGGYPRGLAGEQIPLAARIFAVVDVYDALISDRPYRRAWTHDNAVEHIRQAAGSHFDPDVVDAFLTEIAAEPGWAGRAATDGPGAALEIDTGLRA